MTKRIPPKRIRSKRVLSKRIRPKRIRSKRIKRGKLRSKRKVRRKSTRKSKRKSQSKSRKKYKYQCGGAGCCDSRVPEAYGSSEGRKVALLRNVLGTYSDQNDGLYTFDFLGAQDHTDWVIRVNEDEDLMKSIRDSVRLLIPPLPDGNQGGPERIESIKKNYAYRHPVHVNGPDYNNINEQVMTDVLGYDKHKATDIIGSWAPQKHTAGERMALNHRYSVIGWTPVHSDGLKKYNDITDETAAAKAAAKAAAVEAKAAAVEAETLTGIVTDEAEALKEAENDAALTLQAKPSYGQWNPENGTWFLHAWGVNLEGQWTLDYKYCFNNTFHIDKYTELMNQMFESIDLGIKYVIQNNTKEYVVIRIPQLGLGAWISVLDEKMRPAIFEKYGNCIKKLSEDNPDVIILYPIYDGPPRVSLHLSDAQQISGYKKNSDFSVKWKSDRSGQDQNVTYKLSYYTRDGKQTPCYVKNQKNFTYILWANKQLTFDYRNPHLNQKFEEHADPFGTFDKLYTFLTGIPGDKFSLAGNYDEMTSFTTFEWILVNAWDDGSFIGNIGVRDGTQDGWTVAGSKNKPMDVTRVPSDLPGVEGSGIPMGFQTENAAYLHNAVFQKNFKVITKDNFTTE